MRALVRAWVLCRFEDTIAHEEQFLLGIQATYSRASQVPPS